MKDSKAVEVEGTNCEIVEKSNQFMLDTQAKKRHKILRGTKIFLWLALIAVVVTTLILTIEKYA